MENEPYFCPMCKRNHRPSGAIYKKHLKLAEVEDKDVPCDKILSCKIKLLPQIAQRQINNYLNHILLDKKHNYGKKREMYIQQINKVILHETQNSFMLK